MPIFDKIKIDNVDYQIKHIVGSLFKISTAASSLLNTDVVISSNGETVTAHIDNQGKCECIVPFIGDIVVTYSNGSSDDVHLDYFTVVSLVHVEPIPDTPNVSFNTAYELANELISAEQNYLAGTVLHTVGNGFNTWYSTSNDIANLGWSNMTSDYSAGSHTFANGDITFINTGNQTDFVCNKDGVVVISRGNGATMQQMISNGNVFSFKNVTSGEHISMQQSGVNDCFITFYPKNS